MTHLAGQERVPVTLMKPASPPHNQTELTSSLSSTNTPRAFPAALCHPASFKTQAGEESFTVAFGREKSSLAFCEMVQIDRSEGKDQVVFFSAQQAPPAAKDLLLSEQR